MGHDFELVDRDKEVTEWRHRGNSLSVVIYPTPVAPVASFGIVYRVGSRHEGGGHTGATHLLEHLMFKGSARFNREAGTEIARELQRVGASFNATTWLDRTNYYATLAAEHLHLAVEIEADRMRGALVRPEDLESERTVVLNELERGENDPGETLMRELFAHAYLEHPYRHPTIGWRCDVEQMTADTLRRFYDTYYHPDNATALLAGEVEVEAALELLEANFGGLGRAPAPLPAARAVEGPQRGERRFELHRTAEVGSVAMSWHVPAGLHPDLTALSVLAQVLSEGVTSRLYQRLVETNRCLGVHAFAMELHDPGVFQVFATLAPEVPHREVEAVIREEIATLAGAGPKPEELARAKAQVRTDLAFQRESPAQLVAGLTEAVAVGDWRKLLRELEQVQSVTSDDVQRVAAAYLGDRGVTVGWLIPEGDAGGPDAAVPGPHPCYLREPFAQRVRHHRLPGGARLVALANPHAPTVTLAGALLAGVATAADGRFTMPSLTAAMLDRGTREFDRISLARELEDHGLQLGFEASGSTPSVVFFSAQGLAEELPRLVHLLVETLRYPVFPVDELDKLRQQVLGGLAREKYDTSAQAFAALTRRLFAAGHPLFRRPLAVREAEVRSVSAADLAAFHGATYGPSSLVMAAVGAIADDEVARVLADALAGWTGGAHGVKAWPSPETAEPGQPELLDIPDRPNLDVFIGHASTLRRGDPDYCAAVLANSCLGQSTLTSRLGRAVRDEAGLTYGIYSRFFGTLHLPGPWAIALSVGAEHLDRAIGLCREVVAHYLEEGPGEAELEDERQSLAGSYRVGLATNGGVARELVMSMLAGEPVERLDGFAGQLLATGSEDVAAAVRKHLRPDHLQVAAAGTLRSDMKPSQ